MTKSDVELELHDQIAKFYDDPYGFVMFAYPWGARGSSLERHDGPDTWQRELLLDIGAESRSRGFTGFHPVMPIREGISSGHGVGKTTLQAWLVDWILSTRPYSQGTVTANTFSQLETKTWAAIRRWTKLCITSHWFEVTTSKVYHKKFPESWFCQAQSCKEENSEAFAGQHAADSTSFYIFDEASAISDLIFEVAEGGLSDGEPMIFLFGNPTKRTGKFFRVCFGDERERWKHKTIDSRTSKLSNKELITEWIEQHGLDSDFVRVRVLGLPPRAADAQFIDMQRVLDAQKRDIPYPPDDEPLVLGVDFAWGGDDANVGRFRCGDEARNDGVHLPRPLIVPGELTRDDAVMTEKLSVLLNSDHTVCGRKKRIAMLFMDSAGIAGKVGSNLRKMGHKNLLEVNFGADSPEREYVYYRDYMWGKARKWLLKGAIDKMDTLENDLVGPGYFMTTDQRVKLEDKKSMKRRGVSSPDHGDALALTFAHEVAKAKPKRKQESSGSGSGWS